MTPSSETTPHNLLVLSDLHLNEGWLNDLGRYSNREDFYFDDDFFALLRYHQRIRATPRYGDRPWLLILNGDTFDFEQVSLLPQEGAELEQVCHVTHYQQLDADRRRFGLGTTAAESAWKLLKIAQGHEGFFAALGWFVAHGNRVLFIRGNHDADLYWPQVQEELHHCVAAAYERYRQQQPDAPAVTPELLAQRLEFEPWFYYDPALQVYVEHGTQYEPANHFPDLFSPLHPRQPDMLGLPQGLLLTRYFYNRLEDSYPYSDNVRPGTRAIVWMLTDNPLRGTWTFAKRLGDFVGAWAVIGREQRALVHAQKFSRPGALGAYRGLPASLVAAIWSLGRERASFSWKTWGTLVMEQAVVGLLSLLGLVTGIAGLLALLRSRRTRQSGHLLATSLLLLNVGRLWASIANSDDRIDYMPAVARELAERFQTAAVPLRAIMLGHTHIPRRERVGAAWLVNTGAWIPALAHRSGQWETHFTFARLAVGAEPDDPPEFLEWDSGIGELRRPQLGRPGLRGRQPTVIRRSSDGRRTPVAGMRARDH